MPTNVTLTNYMANGGKGWFPATRGNCTWLNSSITPGDGAASSVKITPSGAGECTLTSAAHTLVASHKYYISFKVRFASATKGTCRLLSLVQRKTWLLMLRRKRGCACQRYLSAQVLAMAATLAASITTTRMGRTRRFGLRRVCCST